MSHASKSPKSPRSGKPGTSTTNEQRRNRRSNKGIAEAADWGGADAKLLQRVIAAIGKHGYAVRFGYTRDGGAYAIGVLGDGDPFTEYVRPNEDIDSYLEGLAIDYENDETHAGDE